MESAGTPCSGAGRIASTVVDSARGPAGRSGVLHQESLKDSDGVLPAVASASRARLWGRDAATTTAGTAALRSRRLFQRKAEGKHRSFAQLAHHPDRSPMCLDDHLRDCQAHACSGRGIPLVLAAIELLKNQRLFERIDAGASVSDASEQVVALHLAGNLDGNSGAGVFSAIL